eukprot:6179113-Pleurochrysis_carterae.AAC.1
MAAAVRDYSAATYCRGFFICGCSVICGNAERIHRTLLSASVLMAKRKMVEQSFHGATFASLVIHHHCSSMRAARGHVRYVSDARASSLSDAYSMLLVRTVRIPVPVQSVGPASFQVIYSSHVFDGGA